MAAARARRADPRIERRGAAVTVTIYHNPDCATSRNTLAMIRQSGEEPAVVEYLKTPPSRERLVELIDAMGTSVRALLREKDTPYAQLGLADSRWTDDELLDFMVAQPILINRPIVVTPKGVRLCRPSEKVLDLLANPDIGEFIKEDGEIVRIARR
jgi:arsenate reductase (glutaredoxin)